MKKNKIKVLKDTSLLELEAFLKRDDVTEAQKIQIRKWIFNAEYQAEERLAEIQVDIMQAGGRPEPDAQDKKKDDLIIRLIEDDIDTISQGVNEGDNTYIADILRDGFVGYRKQSLAELHLEANERGLSI